MAQRNDDAHSGENTYVLSAEVLKHLSVRVGFLRVVLLCFVKQKLALLNIPSVLIYSFMNKDQNNFFYNS